MSTFADIVKSNSSLNSGTLLDLVNNPAGTPSGEIIFKPTDSFETDVVDYRLSANLDIISITGDLSEQSLDADIPTLELSADLVLNSLEGSLCQ